MMPTKKCESTGNEFDLVYVEWEDSFGCSSDWEQIEGAQAAPLVCRSVGWLIQDDKKCKVIVPHMSAIGHPNAKAQGCGDMTIPTSAVVKILRIKLPEE